MHSLHSINFLTVLLIPTGRMLKNRKPRSQRRRKFHLESLEQRAMLTAELSLESPSSAVTWPIEYGQLVRETVQILTTPVPERAGGMASRVSIDGDRLLTNASYEVTESVNQMLFYEYVRDPISGRWSFASETIPPPWNTGSHFDSMVALSGDQAIFDSSSPQPCRGNGLASFYQHQSDTGHWVSQGTVPTFDDAPQCMDEVVVIDGGIATVFQEERQVSVFEHDEINETWSQIASLSPEAGVDGNFGNSMYIDGDRIAIGAKFLGVTDRISGMVYLFDRLEQSNTWTLSDKVHAPESPLPYVETKTFGGSIAMSGDFMVVGATTDNEIGYEKFSYGGAAFVFQRDPQTNTWTQTQKLLGSDQAGDDRFGVRVAIEGDRIAVAATQHDNGGSNLVNTGAVYIFDRSPENGTWTETLKLNAPQWAVGDFFGWDLDLSNGNLVVGTVNKPFEVDGTTVHGAAIVYDLDQLSYLVVHDQQGELVLESIGGAELSRWSIGQQQRYDVQLTARDEYLIVNENTSVKQQLRIDLDDGDDILELSNWSFDSIHGGNGIDTLKVRGDGLTLDTRTMTNITSVEVIDTTSGNNHQVILDSGGLHQISEANSEFTIMQGVDDVIHWVGDWSVLPAGMLDSRVAHRLAKDGMIVQLFNHSVWTNPINRFDVDRSGTASPLDALLIINDLAVNGNRDLDGGGDVQIPNWYLDSNFDGDVTPRDALVIINHLALLAGNPQPLARLLDASPATPDAPSRLNQDDHPVEANRSIDSLFGEIGRAAGEPLISQTGSLIIQEPVTLTSLNLGEFDQAIELLSEIDIMTQSWTVQFPK